ncbi:response regulator transcription factor [Bailinhaonella thermotolerans]|uniref:DNA-binding response regulator n=1 Tax=Bailinhaonella thermotolerans TaxID=1070861 RepID=A0A3A4B0S1_9ACTN|nr:response regulator transcription factor [Bailinhaonella thermotolerans]RJL25202.1 DNA-binding response regulator [Bailinhaonella thermotolerans]
MPLLLVADPAPGPELPRVLEPEGIDVVVAEDGAQALLHAGALHPTAVLVSAALPVIGPVEFVQTVRRSVSVPILLGAGPGDGDTAARALTAGVTACVARPYRMRELLPLVRAACLGETSADHNVLTAGEVTLDVPAHEVRVAGVPVHLPLREFDLLHYLMRNADRTVTRDQIRHHVWQTTAPVSTNTIAVHVKRLRARLGDEDHGSPLIQTVRGIGYRLVPPQPGPGSR